QRPYSPHPGGPGDGLSCAAGDYLDPAPGGTDAVREQCTAQGGDRMKYVDEFRDPELARNIAGEIARLSDGQTLKIMEVCGGHTHTIYKHGIEDVLPRNIDLIHGPGCPVCVLPMGSIDDAIAIARTDGVIFTTFSDMMRVPGSKASFLAAMAVGRDVP